MKTFSRFTINPEWNNVTYSKDIEEFTAEIEVIWEIWYEFPHIYLDDDSISWYKSIIIESEEGYDYSHLEKEYWISPNEIYSVGWISHIVFHSDKIISKYDYQKIQKALEVLTWWVAKDYRFFHSSLVKKNIISDKPVENIFERLVKIYFFTKQYEVYLKTLIPSEIESYDSTYDIKIWEVVKFLYAQDAECMEKDILLLDNTLNWHKELWYSFNYVKKTLWSIQKAKIFFNKYFSKEFITEVNDTQSIIKWGIVLKWIDDIYISEKWEYYTLTPEWSKTISDFYIIVHAKVLQEGWKHEYIVTLVNEAQDVRTPKLIWENKTSTWQFSDWIQSHWPFHFFWSGKNIKSIHKNISSIRSVPVIKQLIGYWFHKKENVVIFKNGIWDIWEKLFTKKIDFSDDFYFNHDWDWYWLTDKQWNDISNVISSWIPSLNVGKVLDLNTMSDFMWELYADHSGQYLLFVAFWILWYLLYWDQEKPFPLIFTRWVTWSGKTAFNELLQKMFWINKAGSDFENSTLFTMTVTLSYLIKFPYFIAEYRENASGKIQKVGTLRSVFDKISQTKGRADQSIIKYEYYAIPVIDGEEMISDWALRTRAIQYQLLWKHKIKGNFDSILRSWEHIISSILFSYLVKSNWDKYQEYLDEGFTYFKWITTQNRISQNISSIYAWCMCFNSSKEAQEMYKIVLSHVCDFQEKDVQQNSTSMQIIKVMTTFLESWFWGLFFMNDCFVISWNALSTFVLRSKIETTLKFDSYREHLEVLWFPVDFYDTWYCIVEWVMVTYEKMPKNFLIHQEIYLNYNQWKKWALQLWNERLKVSSEGQSGA